MLDSLIPFFVNYGYFAVFAVLFLSGLGMPIPEDITLVAGGVISSLSCPFTGSFLDAVHICDHVHWMFIVGMCGVLLGDSIMFLVGYIFGERVLHMRFFSKLISQERYEWAQKKFENNGIFFIFSARFMPGLRALVFVVTGATRKVGYFKFLLTDGIAALISVPIWIYLGFWGERQLGDINVLEHYVKKGQLSIIVVLSLVLCGILSIWYIKKRIQKKTKILS